MDLAYNKYGLRGATTHECMDHYRPDHPSDESSFWWGADTINSVSNVMGYDASRIPHHLQRSWHSLWTCVCCCIDLISVSDI